MAERDETAARKAVLRATLLTARRERLPVAHEDEARAEAALAVPEVAAAATVAAYFSIAGEPGTAVLLRRLQQQGRRVLLPALLPDRDLEFRVYDGGLVSGRFGLSCPPPTAEIVPLDEADVIVVPALACDRRGRRLGRGGGSYDRALPRAAPTALTLALLHPEELWEEIPVDPHDQRVAAVLAGQQLVRCRSVS